MPSNSQKKVFWIISKTDQIRGLLVFSEVDQSALRVYPERGGPWGRNFL